MVVKGVGCDLFVASGRPLRGECRPRGVYRGLRSPAALASPVLSVDPAVFTTAADARQLASSAGINSAAGAPLVGVSVDPAVNSAAGAPPVGVSVDPAVNSAAGAPPVGVSVDPAVSAACKLSREQG